MRERLYRFIEWCLDNGDVIFLVIATLWAFIVLTLIVRALLGHTP